MAGAGFVHDLGIVMGVAAATGILCRRIKQPSILGFLAAGLIVGPYIPIPLFADMDRVHALSEFGVVLVMFAIGLEFQLSRLFKVLPVAGFAALIQIGTLLFFGFFLGRMLGWDSVSSLFLGAGICISSTMLVSKVFEEREISAEVRSLVLGILVLQDVAAIGLIAAMTAVAESGGITVAGLALTLGKLMLTLVVMVAAGLLVVPRLVRYVLTLDSAEAVIITAAGLCFGFAMVAQSMGYSVALGAFVGGLLVSESGHGHDVEHHVRPLQNMFAAVFFVSIGMTVDPAQALANLGPALLLFAGVLVFQLLSISVAGVLSGNGVGVSLTAGLSLGQVGEFGFIIASIGVVAGVAPEGLQSMLVTVAVLTAFTTPMALAAAPRLVDAVDRHMPERFKHLLAFYESWFEDIRIVKKSGIRSPARRAMRAIVLDVVVWAALMGVILYHFDWLTQWFGSTLGLSGLARVLAVYGILLVISIPPLFGLVRNTRHLEEAVLDILDKQRVRTYVHLTTTGTAMVRASIRVLVMMGAGIPVAAVLGPLAHSLELVLVIVAAIFVVLTYFWKSAGRLETEVRSEAERFVAFLDRQRADGVVEEAAAPEPFFPNLGTMEAVYIMEGMAIIGKTLSELNLRAQTGALVVAIHREGKDLVLPTGSNVVQADDLLFLTGSTSAVDKARRLLTGQEAAPARVEDLEGD